MARIRTVKPDFFRHEGLYNAEQSSGLPLRVAFSGLWTAADREGRFRWAPKQLKLDCLPYDEVDFSRVLDALATCGFIVKYTSDGKEYGFIPSWHQHQVINNREKASDLPAPNNVNDLTREARDDDASATPLVQVQGEGKGREREGKGREGETRARDLPSASGMSVVPDAITEVMVSIAHDAGMTVAIVDTEWKLFRARKLSDGKTSADWQSEWFVWCVRWQDMKRPAVAETVDTASLDYDKQLARFKRGLAWTTRIWGPEPGQLGCRAPPELLVKHGFETSH